MPPFSFFSSRAGFAGQLEKKTKVVAEARTDYEECLACQ